VKQGRQAALVVLVEPEQQVERVELAQQAELVVQEQLAALVAPEQQAEPVRLAVPEELVKPDLLVEQAVLEQ
jgi:hypothetical protein